MSVYTVKNVGAEPREWSSSHGGTFLSYNVDFENEDGQVEHGIEWTKKPESRAPTVGERVAGHIEPGKFSDKFKIDYEATKELGPQSSGGGSNSPAGKREWKPESQYDPEKTARIGRAHAQGMAVEVCKAMGIFEGNSAEQIYSKLLGWISWFAADVDQAGKTASQAEGSPAHQQAGSAPPSEASPLPDSQAPRDEHQWFKHLLEAAHMDPEPAHVLAEFISNRFSSEQKARAEEGLEAPELQMDTLAKLKVTYENTEGQDLPGGGGTDDVPF